MFEKLLQWLRSRLDTLFGGAAGREIALSGKMENALSLWVQMYEKGGPWCSPESGLHSLGIAGAVAGEFARLVTMELAVTVTGSQRAAYLNTQLQAFLSGLAPRVELACALGGIVFKPYVSSGRLVVDVTQADCFFPTTFDTTGRLTGAIFSEQIKRKNGICTRLERHEFTAGTETVENKAFFSATTASLGQEVPLTDVPEWADIAPTATIRGVERPLFAYFRIPLANREDRHSPLGMSVFAPAAATIRDADEQYGRLLWEYEGGELAIDVDAAAIRQNPDGSVAMPKREQRLFRAQVNGSIGAGGTLYQAYAPALRDESYRKGLDAMLKRIEFQCGLAYGTLSDPQSVEKTAEEVRASKQRSYAAVKAIQAALQSALDDLLYAMDTCATLYRLAPPGAYQAAYDWDDSILNDPAQRKAMYWDYVQAGKFPFARYLVEFEGYSEAEAAQVTAEAAAESRSDEALTFGGFAAGGA